MKIEIQDISKLRAYIFKITRLIKKQNQDLLFSATEMNIIGHLDRNPQSLPSDLAALEQVSAQAISQCLNNLEQQEFILRTTDPKDKRKSLISLSKNGQLKLSQLKHTRDMWLQKIIKEKLNEKEIELLNQIVPVFEKMTNQ
ncbi:MarR family winged helix-turn-helix transcriptional regulator [Pedobacter montanisoli]|uniref:MarR family transcriptional regulator n=1 Tax=Pedobacter montanisoli TaxID=2923277 RepID=A0ABS9ZUI2_9SPHI|nr:helix-turn-helix domain-containing protein [Pedobacter montanisoli]MCJ0742246.1 MarR family transcriptional regulator [Pedobacter montanisoli]